MEQAAFGIKEMPFAFNKPQTCSVEFAHSPENDNDRRWTRVILIARASRS